MATIGWFCNQVFFLQSANREDVMKWRKTLLRLLLALSLIALLVLGFRPRPQLVDGARVSRGPMARTIEEEGKTRVAQRYLISAPLAGQVRRIQLEAGDEVAAGQVVAVLDAVAAPTLDARRIAEARARVAAAEAALAASRKEAEAAAAAARYASAEENRRRELGRAGYLSASEVESIRAEATLAAAPCSGPRTIGSKPWGMNWRPPAPPWPTPAVRIPGPAAGLNCGRPSPAGC
jgi:HlyD family secretion protein